MSYRLGVGAPIPDSTSVLARETVKLKSKLGGLVRKRGENEIFLKGGQLPLSEDDEGAKGKSTVGLKRPIVDPFSIGGNKKKKKVGDGAIMGKSTAEHAPTDG